MTPFTIPKLVPSNLQHRLLSYLLKRFLGPFLKDGGLSLHSQINSPLESDTFTINNVDLDPTTMQKLLSNTGVCLTLQSASLARLSLRIDWPAWSLSWDNYVPAVSLLLEGIEILLSVAAEPAQASSSNVPRPSTISTDNLDLSTSFVELADDFVRQEGSDSFLNETDQQLPGAFASRTGAAQTVSEPDHRGLFAGLIERILVKLSFQFKDLSVLLKHDQADIRLVVEGGSTKHGPQESASNTHNVTRSFQLSPPTVYFWNLSPQPAASTSSIAESNDDEYFEPADDLLMSQAISDLRTTIPPFECSLGINSSRTERLQPDTDNVFLHFYQENTLTTDFHSTSRSNVGADMGGTLQRQESLHTKLLAQADDNSSLAVILFSISYTTLTPHLKDSGERGASAESSVLPNALTDNTVSTASESRQPPYRIEVDLPSLSVHFKSPDDIHMWNRVLSDLFRDPSPTHMVYPHSSSSCQNHSNASSHKFDFELHCQKIIFRSDCIAGLPSNIQAYTTFALLISMGPLTVLRTDTSFQMMSHKSSSDVSTRITIDSLTIFTQSESEKVVILQMSASTVQSSTEATDITCGEAKLNIDLEMHAKFRPMLQAFDSHVFGTVDHGTMSEARKHVIGRNQDSNVNPSKKDTNKPSHHFLFKIPIIEMNVSVESSATRARNALDHRESGVTLSIALAQVSINCSSHSGIRGTLREGIVDLHSRNRNPHAPRVLKPFLRMTSDLIGLSDHPGAEAQCLTINYGGRDHDSTRCDGTQHEGPAIVNAKLMKIYLDKKQFDRFQYWLDDLSSWHLRCFGGPEEPSIVSGSSDRCSHINLDSSCSASISPVSSVRSTILRSNFRKTTLTVQQIELLIDLGKGSVTLPQRQSIEHARELTLVLKGLSISQTLKASRFPSDTSPHSILQLCVVSVAGVLDCGELSSQLIEVERKGDKLPDVDQCAISITIKTTACLHTSSAKKIVADFDVREIIVSVGSDFVWIHDLFAFMKAPPGAFEAAGPNYVTRVHVVLRAVVLRVSPPSSLGESNQSTHPIIAAVFDEFACKLQLDPSSTNISPEVQGSMSLQLAEGRDLAFVPIARLVDAHVEVSYFTQLCKWRGCVYRGAFNVCLCADSAESLGIVIAGLGQMSRDQIKPELGLDCTGTFEGQPIIQASLLRSAMEDTTACRPQMLFELGEDLVHEDYPADADFLDNTKSSRTALRVNVKTSQSPPTIRSLHSGGLNIIDEFLSVQQGRSRPSTRGLTTEFKVENFDVSIGLYAGYDWTSTRQTIEEAQRAMRKRLQKLRQLLATGHSTDVTTDELASTTLFKSVHLGLSSSSRGLTTAQLLDAIDRELEGHTCTPADDDASLASSWQALPSPPKEHTPSTAKGFSSLQNLRRSRHPALEFSLKDVTGRYREYDPAQESTHREPVRISSVRLNVDHVTVIDNIRTSTWKKFLTELRPSDGGTLRPTGAPMLRVNFDMVRSSEDSQTPEALLKLKIAPIRLYVDQDAVDFLKNFGEFQSGKSEPDQLPNTRPGDSLFFQRVEIFPIRIKLDYKPKRVNYMALQQGKVIELMNFFHFDGSDMTLRHAVLIGVSGPDRIGQLLQDIWTPDIKANQLADVISGIAPVRSVVNVGSGIADLVLLPIEQLRKDGRLARGLQKGTTSFAKSTALEAIKLGAKLATGTQVVLERAEAILGARLAEDVRVETIDQGAMRVFSGDLGETSRTGEREMISRYADQPDNIKMGAKLAYRDLRHNMRTTAQTILAVPLEVFNEGSGRAVVKAVPIAILHPMVGATGAISKTLLGLRHTLDPHASHNDEDKYKRSSGIN